MWTSRTSLCIQWEWRTMNWTRQSSHPSSSLSSTSQRPVQHALRRPDHEKKSSSPKCFFSRCFHFPHESLVKRRCLLQVIDVGHFWGFQADEASLGKQRRLTAEINQRTLLPVSVSLYPNLLCLAPYSEDKEQSLSYYRAKILHLRNNSVEVNTRSHTPQPPGCGGFV